AEAAAWFLGEEAVGTLPSRGVRWGSGLEPPPHLVGERARALAVLARGGLVVASAQAVSEGLPPAEARPEPIELAPGRELGVEGLSEALALAGYDRVERVDGRGQFAAGSSTCSRRRGASRSASSSSATRSSRSARSRRSPSAHCIPSRARPCMPPS